jgi:hypothetical protein
MQGRGQGRKLQKGGARRHDEIDYVYVQVGSHQRYVGRVLGECQLVFVVAHSSYGLNACPAAEGVRGQPALALDALRLDRL